MKNLLRILKWIIFLILSIALIRDTFYNGWDFNVFYQAAVALWSGENPYLLGMHNGWVYKYPPWSLVLFSPLGLFSLSDARLIWGFLQVVCIFYSYLWVQKRLKFQNVGLCVLASFWFLFAYHALAGQISLFILVGCLYFLNGLKKERFTAVFGILFLLSLKIFPVFSWVGFHLPKKEFRPALLSMGILLALTALVSWFCLQSFHPFNLIQSWIEAAGSSATQLDAEATRGWRNQGFPAIFGRLLGDRGGAQSLDVPLTVFFYLFFGFFWKKISTRLTRDVQWAGWIALAAAIHPLSWFHSFVLAYPLAAFTLDHAWESENKMRILISLFGVFCITLFTKTFGAIGSLAEVMSVKSIGVLICLFSFQMRQKKLLLKSLTLPK